MKPHKHARLALKALHQAGQEKKRIKRIIPDISSAIEKISDIKVSCRPELCLLLEDFGINFL